MIIYLESHFIDALLVRSILRRLTKISNTYIGIQNELSDLLDLLGAQTHRQWNTCDFISCSGCYLPHPSCITCHTLAVARACCAHDNACYLVPGENFVHLLNTIVILQSNLLAIELLHFELYPDIVHNLHTIVSLQSDNNYTGLCSLRFPGEDHHITGSCNKCNTLLSEETAPRIWRKGSD